MEQGKKELSQQLENVVLERQKFLEKIKSLSSVIEEEKQVSNIIIFNTVLFSGFNFNEYLLKNLIS